MQIQLDEQLKTERVTVFPFERMTKTLEHKLIIERLKQACILASHRKHQEVPPPTPFLDAIITNIEASDLLTNEEGDIHFQSFRKILNLQNEKLPASELRSLYLLAINFAISKVNNMDERYFSETLQLYQWALDNEILEENNQLSPYTYNNSIALAIRMGELDWAFKTTEKYKTRLPEKHRSAIVALNQARIAYAKSNLHTALIVLQKADYKDLFHLMSAKVMQLKIYYVLDELEALESHLENMRILLQRQKTGGYHIANYRNIVRFAKKLIRINPDDKKAVNKLRSQVAINKRLTERKWLLEQIDTI